MKGFTPSQIQQAKNICSWENTKFHGNKKKVGHLTPSQFALIVEKKKARQACKRQQEIRTPERIARNLVKASKENEGTPYFKTMIEGSTGIYLASPEHGHKDYNKTRLFDKTERTIKIMNTYNNVFKIKQ